MKTDIEFTAIISIDFKRLTKQIQHDIKEGVILEADNRILDAKSSTDIYDMFVDYVSDYLDENLPFDNAYDSIYAVGCDDAINTIIDAFKEWLRKHKEELKLY